MALDKDNVTEETLRAHIIAILVASLGAAVVFDSRTEPFEDKELPAVNVFSSGSDDQRQGTSAPPVYTHTERVSIVATIAIALGTEGEDVAATADPGKFLADRLSALERAIVREITTDNTLNRAVFVTGFRADKGVEERSSSDRYRATLLLSVTMEWETRLSAADMQLTGGVEPPIDLESIFFTALPEPMPTDAPDAKGKVTGLDA